MRVLGITNPDSTKSFCDKRCHTSTKRHCTCICQGLLHGRGEAYAKSNAPAASYYADKTHGGSTPVWLNPELVRQTGS